MAALFSYIGLLVLAAAVPPTLVLILVLGASDISVKTALRDADPLARLTAALTATVGHLSSLHWFIGEAP